ncbi:MAG: hypothetical protein ACRDAM_12100 [Casimicrobium sp.]
MEISNGVIAPGTDNNAPIVPTIVDPTSVASKPEKNEASDEGNKFPFIMKVAEGYFNSNVTDSYLDKDVGSEEEQS